MVTENQSVTAEDLLSATVKYSNKDDASRVYDISANVRIENGKVSNFENGEVRKSLASTDAMEGMNNIATFNSYSEKNLNLYINNADETEASAILSAIYAFMADVKATVSTNITIA